MVEGLMALGDGARSVPVQCSLLDRFPVAVGDMVVEEFLDGGDQLGENPAKDEEDKKDEEDEEDEEKDRAVLFLCACAGLIPNTSTPLISPTVLHMWQSFVTYTSLYPLHQTYRCSKVLL